MAISLSFFGLTREPFKTTPDPSFLYLSPSHREALAQLVYGVREHKGFVLLIGEVGTGKTTLLQALMKQLGDNTAVAFVSHSMTPFEGLLECILASFGIAKAGQSLAQQLLALQNFLVERHHAGQNTVVILDEAQNLEPQTLEQIRLLSNLETASEKILQIVLAGQPELMAKLDLPALRQLKQRIALRCRLVPLTAAETRDYIRTRLAVAGAIGPGLFNDEAVARIARYTGGIPRLVNNVCDHCLVIGYADQVRRLDRKIVEEAIQYFTGGSALAGRALRSRGLLWASGVGVAVAGAWAALGLETVNSLFDHYASPLLDFVHSMRALIAK